MKKNNLEQKRREKNYKKTLYTNFESIYCGYVGKKIIRMKMNKNS